MMIVFFPGGGMTMTGKKSVKVIKMREGKIIKVTEIDQGKVKIEGPLEDYSRVVPKKGK